MRPLTIWKYELTMTGEQTVLMPQGAQVLSAQFQGESLCFWAIVDPAVSMRQPRKFYIVGTGHQVPDDFGRYVGTVQQHDGMLIWHIFEGE